MTDTITITAGIDTSKGKLDVAVHGHPGSLTVDNARPGWKTTAEQLRRAGVTRVGIEATGGYERGVLRYLQQAGFEVVLLQPLQVKAFARLHLRRAKTDRLDAILIAACTVAMDAHNTSEPDARFDALGDHLTFIEQLEEDIARFKTRLEHITQARLRRTVLADVARLEKRRAAELRRLQAEVQDHADLWRRYQLVLSVPGIGARTALAVVLRMPELVSFDKLGQVSREQAAALAGLAPFVQQSGKRAGETHIGGGRSRLRRSLYAAALPASFHWNPACKALYQRLVGRGKTHTAALVACARKLLVFANTVVQRGTPWQPRQATAPT